jgi:hypothetical protein
MAAREALDKAAADLKASLEARPRGHSACSIDLVYRFRLGLLVVELRST